MTTLLKDTVEILQIRQWLSDLHTGLYINCQHCGYRYGAKTEKVPADIIRQHVMVCTQHPMFNLVVACRTAMSRFSQCRVIHSSHPRGTTCLGVREHARDNADQYTPEFRDELINTDEHLCDACFMQSIIGELVG